MAASATSQAHVIGQYLGQSGAVVVDEKVEPAVIVIVPKPTRERPIVRRADNTQVAGDIAKMAIPFVVVEPARPSMFEMKRSSRPSPS